MSLIDCFRVQIDLDCFDQVSGIFFSFDASRPAGHRVIEDSVYVRESPHFAAEAEDRKLDPNREYRVVMTEYLASGKDGFEMLATLPTGDADGPVLPTLIRNDFLLRETTAAFLVKRRSDPSFAARVAKK